MKCKECGNIMKVVFADINYTEHECEGCCHTEITEDGVNIINLKYEEAIRRITQLKAFVETRELVIALDLSIESLKKQIPTKPIIEAWSPALCPSCNAQLSESGKDGYYKHRYSLKICDCGQKISWN